MWRRLPTIAPSVLGTNTKACTHAFVSLGIALQRASFLHGHDSTAKMSASIGDGIGDEEIFPAS